MGTGTLRRHYAGYDSRQMGRIEDQPRDRILEAYYAERDRVKRLESEIIALGKPVPPRDDDQAPGDHSPPGTNAQPLPEAPTAPPTPAERREHEEMDRIAREARYPLDANAGNEKSREAELLPGQDRTDAEPSKSVSLTPEKGENMDHPIDPKALEDAKGPIVEHTTGPARRRK